MDKHGIFISYRHKYDHGLLAGRIYDYLDRLGFDPFLDVYCMPQSDYTKEIIDQIHSSPYFLSVLTPGALDDLTEDDWVYREIKEALLTKKEDEILVVACEGFVFPDVLPEEISKIRDRHFFEIGMASFYHEMERIDASIDRKKMEGVLNWREYASAYANTIFRSRLDVERGIASLENRFGYELIQCVKQKQEFHGEQRVQRICMSCYAASLILANAKNMIDNRAYDHGLMFNVFRQLLMDPEFSIEMVLTAPNSAGAIDAVENKKLGNDALEDYPEAVFLGYYSNMTRLIEEDPVFREAHKEKRFRFMVTDKMMTAAIFQIVYKPPYEEFNHVKVDFYTSNLASSIDRRCVVFFEQDNKENYDYFVDQYRYLRDVKHSKELIRENNDAWLEEWEELEEEING